MSLKMMSSAMKQAFGMANHGQQGKGGLDPHAVIPGAFDTQLQIVRNASFTAKAQVRQDDPIFHQQVEERQEVLVTVIHRQPMPADDLSQPIDNPAQFHTNRPTTF